ncbi:MAG: cyclase family protein [Armatimonadota bacterium]
MDIVLLSYPLRVGGPVYPGEPTLTLDRLADTGAGDPCNSRLLHLFNHFGTHVDGPTHFNPSGPSLDALPIEAFVFQCPGLLDIPKTDDELITAGDLRATLPQGWLCDLLLLRTGFGRVRETDTERYIQHSPGLSPEAAELLFTDLPTVRAIALDTLSVSALAHRDDGRMTHQVLCGLGRKDGRFVLTYEDVNLVPLHEPPLRVWGLPLLFEDADGAPVTMVAEV